LESMVEWMSYALYYAFDGAAPPARTGASHATIFPYGSFAVGDGKTVMLGIQNEREWADFCDKVLDSSELGTDPRYSSNTLRSASRQELRKRIEDVFSRLTSEQVIERLDDAKIANAHVNEVGEVWNHLQLKERGRWTVIDTPVGRVPALLPPGKASVADAQMGPVPALGQQTDAILSELGYDREAIRSLRARQVI
jgi:itaconate CoA-transferase